MSEIKVINGLKDGIEAFQKKVGGENSAGNFDDVLKEAMGKISQIENDVEKAVKELASGGDVVEAMVAIEKADMSFQLMVEVRNKLLSAYEEISRMQI